MSATPGWFPRTAGSVLCTAAAAIALTGMVRSAAHAQNPAPLSRIEALGLETIKVGRVSAYFDATDRSYAETLANLSERAVSTPIEIAHFC